MSNLQESIDELDTIINISIRDTPRFLRGVLITEELVPNLIYLIDLISEKAKKSDEYFEMCMEWARVSDNNKFKFVKAIMEGKLTINQEKVKNEEI